MPIHQLIPAGIRNLLSAHRSRVLPALGILAASASLTGCSLFASAGGGRSDTDTVPLPGREDHSAYDSPDAIDSEADGNRAGDDHKGMGWAADRTGDSLKNPHLKSSDPKIPDQKTAGKSGGTPNSDVKTTREPSRGSLADAWAAPRIKTPINLNGESVLAPTKSDTGSVLEVPVPTSTFEEPEKARPLLPLAEFRKRVFALQQKEEADRFREAINSEKLAEGEIADEKLGDEKSVPTEKPGGEVEKPNSSPDSPRIKAAYQIYRWNLMETLAGAERAYWNFHFSDRKFAEAEKSLGHLAGINDRARLGVLRKTRVAEDIFATETLRSHRQIAVAELDARRTVAMSEVASFYTAFRPDGSAPAPTVLVRTEAPAKVNPSTDAAALVGRAEKVHPLYIAERQRNDTQPAAEPSAHIQERIEGSLGRLQSSGEAAAKAHSQTEIFSSAYDENLRNFGNGTINLEGITAFEKAYFTARQEHLDALLDFQNFLIDLELEVGDFLENRGQEVPLADLLAD